MNKERLLELAGIDEGLAGPRILGLPAGVTEQIMSEVTSTIHGMRDDPSNYGLDDYEDQLGQINGDELVREIIKYMYTHMAKQMQGPSLKSRFRGR